MSASADEATAERDPRSSAALWGQWCIVLFLFAGYSAVCRPVPSVNEPHYLGKAKHYWQPEWAAGDFFLESSNPHLVFYQTIGVLTRWLTLPQAAVVGRLIVLALLAWGWTRLITRISPHRSAPIGTACLFLLLQAAGNFSGEWLVGGVESKVVAYAFAFAGFASLMEMRLVLAGICLGIAVSFHAVAGGWCVIALAMALGWLAVTNDQQRLQNHAGPRTWAAGLAALVLCALPGVVPAVRSLAAADPAAAAVADRFQVGTRLAHHLDPMVFPVEAYRFYALLFFSWLLLRRPATTPPRRLFVAIVMSAMVIAVVGILVGWGPRPIHEMPLAGLRIWLLKFYPFRLADLLLPMLVAITVFEGVCRWSHGGTPHRARWVPIGLVSGAYVLALLIPAADKNPSRMDPARESEWIAACQWIRANTPTDSLIYAANEDWAVRWFTHRAEYVNYKDCPQDAAGILEWVRRLRRLRMWHREALTDGSISAEDLAQLRADTGITHLLASRLGRVEVPPVYHNDSFRVYATGGETH